MKINLVIILKIFLPIILVISVCVLIIKFIFSGYFNLKYVYIEADSALISDISIFQKQQNLLLLSTRSWENKIKDKYHFIKQVDITKQLPNALNIKIILRQPIIKTFINQQDILFDEDGQSIPHYQEIDINNLPLLSCDLTNKIENNQINDNILIRIFKLINKMSNTQTLYISQLVCEDNRYYLYINSTKIIIDPNKNTDEMTGSLQLLFKQFRIEGKTPKSIDLRFDKPVILFD